MTDAMTTGTDYWHVQLTSGEVRYWSLEELDEAFQRDEVDARTYVLKEGESAWQRLGELLGLDEAESAPAPVAVAPYSVAPLSYAAARPSEAPAANSIRPFVSDIDLEEDAMMAQMKPRRRNVAFIGGGVAAALVLVVVGVTRAGAGSDAKAAAAAPPPAVVAPPAAAEPVAAPVAAAQPALSDDVKKSLLEADKSRAAKAAARAAENAKFRPSTARGGSYRAPKSGQVFHKGGNQFDPLTTGN